MGRLENRAEPQCSLNGHEPHSEHSERAATGRKTRASAPANLLACLLLGVDDWSIGPLSASVHSQRAKLFFC